MNDVAVAYVSFNRRATSELLGWYENCMHGQNCFVWMSELSNEYFSEFERRTASSYYKLMPHHPSLNTITTSCIGVTSHYILQVWTYPIIP